MSVLRFTDEQLADYQARRGVGNVEPVRLLNPRGRLPDPRESEIQAPILDLLRRHPRVAWARRINTGAARYEDKNGKQRFVAYGFKGCADILGMLRGGRLLAVECKRRGEKPTDEQRAFIEAVNGGGGLGVVACSIDDVLLALDDKVPA